MFFLRSFIFNIAIYGMTGILSFLACWTCLLPRKYALKTAHLWNEMAVPIEKHVMGLSYEIKGKKNLPKDGCFIVASKHQSVWETVKLHHIFGDPAIVLKKELLNIPFMGRFFEKLEMIAIDRSRSVNALKLIETSANKVKKQGRPIIIFPQGTRVPVRRQMSYKYGAVRLYNMLDVPIVPIALNSGVFWPKNCFYKKGGKITIEILPPIKPGLPAAEALKQMQHSIEERSDFLCEKAIKKLTPKEQKCLKIPPLIEKDDET